MFSFFKTWINGAFCSMLILWAPEGLYSSVEAPSGVDLHTEAQVRLSALRHFIPAKAYRWQLLWETGKQKTYGTLTGNVFGKHHSVEIFFEPNASVFFDKNNPTWVLYPNRLCLYPKAKWACPLKENPGLNIYALTLPFLNWPVSACEKAAKFGRHALKVLCCNGAFEAQIYIDQTFNTLLCFTLSSPDSHTAFKLKHLKKFGRHWSLHSAEFQCNSIKTSLKVLSVRRE